MTRVEVMLEGEYFGDELRVSGGEGWIDEVPAGAVVLSATNDSAKSVGKVRVVTSSGQTTEASIRMQSAGQVHGHVQLPAGTQGASVTLTSPLGLEQAEVAPDGTFAFESVFPGEYVAKVMCQGCGALSPKSVTLTPGGTVELQFP